MTARERNEVANGWTQRGIELLERGDELSLKLALADFEQAIEQRLGLPLDEDPVYRWGLAAGWMNRGDALHRLGRQPESVGSYDDAIAVLAKLEAVAAVRNRTALAWNGRGLASGEAGDFAKAIEIIGEPIDAAQTITLAAARLHRSRITEVRDKALEDAKGALELLKTLETEDRSAAEIGLKARHRICRCWCEWLEAGRGEPPVEDWISSTTDMVEEALALERAWELAGVRSMRGVARDLFQLGLKVYGTCQPHFLAEFLMESIDPDRSPGAPCDDVDFQAAAVNSLKETMAGVLGHGTSHLDEAVARDLALLEKLQAADRRLAELQQKSICD